MRLGVDGGRRSVSRIVLISVLSQTVSQSLSFVRWHLLCVSENRGYESVFCF